MGDSSEKWDAYLLKTYGLPQEPQPRAEISETAFVGEEGRRSDLEALAGRQIRLGEEPPRGLLKVWAEDSGPEGEGSEKWKRAQGFYRVFARIAAHDNQLNERQRDELLKQADELRPDELGGFPESMGSPEEFYARWKRYDLEVAFTCVSRHLRKITIFERTPKFWAQFGKRPEKERG